MNYFNYLHDNIRASSEFESRHISIKTIQIKSHITKKAYCKNQRLHLKKKKRIIHN